MTQISLLPESTPCPFVFKDHHIRTIVEDESLWFAAKDVCAALGIGWNGTSLASIQREWQGMRSFRTPSGNQRLRAIQEPAVYKLAFRSNKEEADEFTNWIASEVVPSIRKTGQYALQPTPPKELASDPITPDQQCTLRNMVKAKIDALPADQIHKGLYTVIWSRFNNHFRIAKYNQLPQGRLSEGIAYLMNIEVVAGPKQKELPTTAHNILPIRVNYLKNRNFTKARQAAASVSAEAYREVAVLANRMEKLAHEAKKGFSPDPDECRAASFFDCVISFHEAAMKRQARIITEAITSFVDTCQALESLAKVLEQSDKGTELESVRRLRIIDEDGTGTIW